MQPRIEVLKEKKLVGQNITMSVSNNLTGHLWSTFAPRIKTVPDRSTKYKISLQIYPPMYFQSFNPTKSFEKWAVVEVESFENIPNDMKSYILPGGLYAVFDYKGLSSDPAIFQYIYSKWLPNSGYTLDDRPHFEVLGQKYNNNDPDSEEEIWIPIKNK